MRIFYSTGLNNLINKIHEKSLEMVHLFIPKTKTVHYGFEMVLIFYQKKSMLEFESIIKRWNPIRCDCRICKFYVPNLFNTFVFNLIFYHNISFFDITFIKWHSNSNFCCITVVYNILVFIIVCISFCL